MILNRKSACPVCKGLGTRCVRFEYPWGGSDELLEFCTCWRGREEELQAYRFYSTGFDPDRYGKPGGDR